MSALRIPLVCALILLAAFSACADDEVILRGGRTLTGKILREDDREVVLRMDGGAEVTFKRSEVVEIKRAGRIPEPQPDSTLAQPEAPPSIDAASRGEFSPGLLDPKWTARVDLFALCDFPEAFEGGRYTTVARFDGFGALPFGFDGMELLELEIDVCGFSRIEAEQVAFLMKADQAAPFASWKDRWVEATFTLERRMWDSPSYGPVPIWIADVTELTDVQAAPHPGAFEKSPAEWEGKDVPVYVRLAPGQVPVDPGPLRHTVAGGITAEIPAELVDLACRHPFGFFAKVRSSRDGAAPLLRILEIDAAVPFDRPDTAMLWHRFRPAGLADLHTRRLDRLEESLLDSLERHGQVPAHAFDLREPEEASGAAGQDHEGRLVTSGISGKRTGLLWFEGTEVRQAADRDALRALTPRPDVVHERVLGRVRTASGPGTVTSGGTTIGTTVTGMSATPMLRRLVWNEAKGDWLAPDLAPVRDRALDLLRRLSPLLAQQGLERYDTRELESRVSSLERRIEWLDTMLARENTRPDAVERMRGERDQAQSDLAAARAELARAQGAGSVRAGEVGPLRVALWRIWRGEATR